MTTVAIVVGYSVIVLAAGFALVLGGLFLIAWFPVRFQWTIKPPSYIKTPNHIQNIDALIGLGNRGGGRAWFFGLLMVSPGQEPRIKPRQPFQTKDAA